MERLFTCKNVIYIGTLLDGKHGPIPLFEIREPSREEWNRMARKQAIRNKKNGVQIGHKKEE